MLQSGVAKAPRPAAQTRVGEARVDVVCKAPCAWRVPPPSRGRSPLLPVCKSYQQCKKGPARLLVLGVRPPPAGPGPRYCPYAKVISSARSNLQKVLLRGVHPPPQPGQVPAKLSTALNHRRFRVWVVVPLAEPHSGCPARLTLAGPQICNGVSA